MPSPPLRRSSAAPPVVAGAAVQRIVAQEAVDLVGAVVAEILVGTLAAVKRVAEGRAEDLDVLDVDQEVEAAGDRDVCEVAAEADIVADTADDRIDAVIAQQAAIDRVHEEREPDDDRRSAGRGRPEGDADGAVIADIAVEAVVAGSGASTMPADDGFRRAERRPSVPA